MDYIFGTDKEYRKSINFTRDRIFFTLKSAREEIPDLIEQTAGSKKTE